MPDFARQEDSDFYFVLLRRARQRKLVVLIGQKKALAMAVRNDTARRRYTKLRERLAGSSTGGPGEEGS